MILDKELYNNLADNHLNSNNKTYNELDHNPLKLTITKVNSCLTELNRTGDISNRLFSQLLSKDDSKLGKFRILIKLHKVKLGVRPIINSINHPTSKLSHFIDLFLQPYVKESNSYIKDSQNLIQDCNDLRLDNTTNLFSCDFESLYTNINSNQAIEQICIFFQTKLNNQFDFSIKGLYEILKLILFNNIFSFNNKFFIQLNGLAMGTKCGPTIANIFIAILETKWLYLHKPLVYKRFIDDIFVITYKSNIESLEKNFGNLKLNLINDKEVQFLDLIISIDEYSNKLKFKLYTKSTNTFQYLFYNSNHPNHIFSNIPKSLFIRIRRICSDYTDYLYYSRRLIVQLLKRGYKFENLLKISLEIGNIDRNKLIPYKDKGQLS